MGRIVTLDDAYGTGAVYGIGLDEQERYWAYNALDVTGTREVFDVLHSRLDTQTAQVYAFERALQAPALTMMRRGVLVDEPARKQAVKDLGKDLRRLEKSINKLPEVYEVWDLTEKETGACKANEGKKHRWPRGEPDETRVCSLCGAKRLKLKPFNPASSKQSMHLFRDLYGVPDHVLRKKDKSYGIDEDVLLRIKKYEPGLTPVVDGMLDIRGVKKQLGFLKAKLSPTGRFHSSFNVGAAWTGRWSSSKDPFGRGGNMQNIAERHRHIFIADPGMTMFYADLKQAESLLVAHLAGDDGYIEAHTSGDTHTHVARLVWAEDLPWTGDLKKDKALAKENNPEWDRAPGHEYRFQAKRIQHGGNYGLTPQGIAMIAKIPKREAEEAYENYHGAFPGIQVWQRNTKAEVMEGRALVNPLGRRIRLFGRPWDGHTYKQGLSYRPQSGVADILNLALWLVWRRHDPELVLVLAQVHDAILGQFRTEATQEALAAILDAMTLPVEVLGADGKWRTMTIPVEIAIGENWGKYGDDNPIGLKEVQI